MRLLVDFGYTKLLFGKGVNYAQIIDALNEAKVVEEDGPWGERVLVAKDKELSIKLIDDDSVKLPETTRPEVVDKLLIIAKERDDLKQKVYQLEEKIKKVAEAV